ncbi:MAG: hypothetical protein Q4D98_00255 [Planctomycetia bacterium]|nr:hypothetical protein [Planctomycetia bacterium]
MMKRVLILFLAIGFCVGCGDGRPRRYPVMGTLLIDGKPAELPENFIGVAAVTFRPESGGRDAYANLNPDGTFQVGNYGVEDGCPLGKFQVAVQFYKLVGSVKKSLIPLRYEEYATSGLGVTIDKETRNVTIEISSQ